LYVIAVVVVVVVPPDICAGGGACEVLSTLKNDLLSPGLLLVLVGGLDE
jgi:hypothetical protein